MKFYTRHIAWLFILMFAIFGIEKINFSSEPICSKNLKFCPNATMYIYNTYSITGNNQSSEKSKETNSSKITTISCESYFINQSQVTFYSKENTSNNLSLFYYKPVIHSTPYIPLVDPPPIV
ncbi:hypothetical protein LNQ81_06765 [Myroides sp. M-43]|uniref:hypothetical protein n=1 Tax=Myroides oncorhynchi TaxID=2893756 RepID=UPI001E4740BB|nr:hypothetical protein [Myroides oncorhynchi]MCC9042395.1 hypothetical protein [Myroides oncorhynchi]